MTARHPDDEALSAVLDGEGDDADRTHVDGCPTCQARLDQLRVVSRAVGATVASRPAVDISAAVSRALADGPLAPIGRLPGRRAPGPPRSGRSAPRGSRLMAIAAIVFAVAGIATLIAVVSNHKGASRNSATSATVAAPANSANGAQATAGGAVATPAPSSPAPQAAAAAPAPHDLGDQSDPAVLAAALRALERQGLPGVATTILSPPACAPMAASGAGLDPGARALFDAPLRWKGQDAEVLIFALPTAGGGQSAVVVAASCAVLVSFPL